MQQPLLVEGRDRDAVVEVIHRYFWLADHGLADQIPSLFASDCRLTIGGRGTFEGKSTISESMRARALQSHITTRHIVSNLTVSRQPSGSIHAYSLLTLFRSEDARRDTTPFAVADVEDVFVSEQGVWKISERTLTTIFSRT